MGQTVIALTVAILMSAARSASAQMLPVSIQVDGTGNGILESGETAEIVPSWRNPSPFSLPLLSTTLTSFFGPPGATYSIVDGSGFYSFPPLSPPVACFDCYGVRITAAARPVTHWDATLPETLIVSTKEWTLHVGATFDDVPRSSPFYRFVETIVHKNVTGGCTADAYCPASSTTREQMAVFLLVAKEPAGYLPPVCGAPMFGDVPSASPFCRWIEELARRGVVAGCGGGNYCPGSAVSREQMSVFVLRTLDPALDPPACVAGSEMFADVAASSDFCRWIEELARRGVVTGCGSGNYCPAADVGREQMSVFLTVAFGLTLYGL